MSWPMLIMPQEPPPPPRARRRRIAQVVAWLSAPALTVCVAALLILAAAHLVQLHGIHDSLDQLLDTLAQQQHSNNNRTTQR